MVPEPPHWPQGCPPGELLPCGYGTGLPPAPPPPPDPGFANLGTSQAMGL